jgi:aerobic-type carbon monoxide dehydrogenase small subunit (CoxS/CutS family)
MATVKVTLNGEAVALDTEHDDELLLDALRDRMGLTSVRYCCGIGVCGTCTVLLDGAPVSSCLLLVSMVAGRRVDTAEHVLGDLDEDGVRAAFVGARAFQCSYCIPAMALTVAGLIADQPDLAADELREQLGGNICRCGSYPQVLDAVRRLTTKE